MFLPKAGKTAPRTFSAPARPDDRRWPRLKIPVKDVNGDRPPICLRPVPRFAPRFASVWAVSRSSMGRAHFDLRDGICPTCARHGRIRLRPRDQGRRASRKRRAIKKPASLKMRVFQRSRHYLEKITWKITWKNSWCRRRDSNSHSFRHYPLKIACLPISPRRLTFARKAMLSWKVEHSITQLALRVNSSRHVGQLPPLPAHHPCQRNKPLQAAPRLASICHVGRQYWRRRAHTRDHPPGNSPPRIFI